VPIDSKNMCQATLILAYPCRALCSVESDLSTHTVVCFYYIENIDVYISNQDSPKRLFISKNFLDFDTVALSFLFDKHCLIIE